MTVTLDRVNVHKTIYMEVFCGTRFPTYDSTLVHDYDHPSYHGHPLLSRNSELLGDGMIFYQSEVLKLTPNNRCHSRQQNTTQLLKITKIDREERFSVLEALNLYQNLPSVSSDALRNNYSDKEVPESNMLEFS
ncbi:hypothetical protein TNCV_3559331 [Trichonephila clavipes]|uniref:Uncharacterized protein n=1 Tax=Trichonephila clavipes TaxID=2585209 RepID=A0A8X6WCU7_TRICX|nr:hypothetical protein TNCV_3559331 [Trichonephila clavipes]